MFHRLVAASIAVPKIEDALPVYTEGLGLKLMAMNPGRRGYGLRLAALGDGESSFLELLDSPEDGPVSRFLARNGPGVYQLRLESENLYETVLQLQKNGVEIVFGQPVGGGPRYTEATPDIELAFVHPRASSGVLIELVRKKS